jgi:eukaryotic-like serine/threonine-protein kinase
MTTDLTSRLQQSLGDSYRIERELGGGGMSRVFVAEDLSLGRRIALKVLPPELAGQINADRFRREILLAAKLQDPHIVAVLSAGQTDDGTPYYTMPLVDGESLRGRLARHGALPISQVLSILRDVAKALTYAHELGVVHRDIKPDNVLLTRRDALVADFGVAKAVSSARDEVATPTLTVAGTALGTPAYMAPEQIAADPNMDHRADIYAFGAMAYEMLTGRPPFVGSAPQRILAAHLSQMPEDVISLRQETPPALASLVMRCLSKEPSERPQGAGEILEDLDSLITSGGYAAAPAIAAANRYSLGKALAIYALSFAAVAILARAAVVGIGLPEWVFTGALILMALGLPVVLFTAFVHHHSRAVPTPGMRTPGGSPQHSTMTQLSLKARPHVTWRRTVTASGVAMGIFVLTVAGYMAMRMLGIGPAGSLMAAGVLDRRSPVLVAEFEAAGADTLLGSVVTEAFRTDLGQSRAVTAVQPVFVEEALRRMQMAPNTRLSQAIARELAAREGIPLLVEGDVTPVGSGYVLSARLVSPASGEILAAFRETAASGDQLIPAIDRLSKRTRERIGESIRSVRASPPLEQVTTRSLEALRKYTQALDPHTDYDRGVQLLEEAIALDTTFAMAYRRLGVMFSNRGEATRARPMIERAYAHRERLPAVERYLTEGSYWGTAMGDQERAIAAYEAALEVAPTNRVALNNVALLYGQAGEFERGERYLHRALAADSTFMNGYMNLTFAQAMSGRVREARVTIDRAIARFPNSAELVAADLRLRYATGDGSFEQQLADAVTRFRLPSDRLLIGDIAASYARLRGRVNESHRVRAELAGILRQRTAHPALVDLELTGDSAGVLVDLVRDQQAAARMLDALLRSPRLQQLPESVRPYWGVAHSAALLGQPQRARELLRQWETHAHSSERAQMAHLRPLMDAAIARAEGRHQQSLELARSASIPMCPPCALPALSAAYDSAGVPDSVIAVSERYLTATDLGRIGRDAHSLANVRERLAQLYAARGDRPRAGAYYRALLEQWRDADAELQPRVRAARAALNSLERPRSS